MKSGSKSNTEQNGAIGEIVGDRALVPQSQRCVRRFSGVTDWRKSETGSMNGKLAVWPC